jgi:hypothetical protein
MFGAQGLRAGRDLYRATPAVTQDLGFSGLIRRTAPISRLLRHTRGCGGPILTRILTRGENMLRYENIFITNIDILPHKVHLIETSYACIVQIPCGRIGRLRQLLFLF